MVKKQTTKNSKSSIDEDKAIKTSQRNSSSKIQKEPQTMEELLAQTGGIHIGLKKGETVEGTVVSVSSKEVLIDIGKKSYGIIANWELEQVKDYAATLKVGDKITAQVVNSENDMGYAVLSVRKTSTERRWVILNEKKESGEEIEVNGLEIAKGGLLVEWQSLRGFIPATQLDSSFSSNPATLIGKTIKVKVLEVDQSLNRLVLSQKAASLGVSPVMLKEKLNKIKPNDVLKGIISGIAPFGLFVDIEGLEGLVHISEIAWEKVENPGNLYKVGDKVEIMVIDVNQNEGKLNLSIKRLTPDPWKNILDRYPPESTVSGKVVRIAPYGVFVHVETGIEGLIHISKIPAGGEPKIGEEIKCIVENIDPVKRKISLTLVPHEKPVGYR
ncbi:S1 RNA-binding domain-containing protein [Patescibacteria group bacterium]|nr:S1 RNA-binding domain-containing protein [Patescibacteria group bacterium]MCL5798454.1 S1 RNA-binding domain-containing protein [Patescibacteria group bacterium]